MMKGLNSDFKYERHLKMKLIDINDILKLYRSFFILIQMFNKVKLMGVNKNVLLQSLHFIYSSRHFTYLSSRFD